MDSNPRSLSEEEGRVWLGGRVAATVLPDGYKHEWPGKSLLRRVVAGSPAAPKTRLTAAANSLL